MEFKPGECYENAYWAAHDAWHGNGIGHFEKLLQGEVFLVHGYPTLTSGDFKGQMYGHAWVELEKLGLVIDGGTGTVCVRNLYYQAGKITIYTRHTELEAAKLCVKHENYGPWDTPPKGALFKNDEDVYRHPGSDPGAGTGKGKRPARPSASG